MTKKKTERYIQIGERVNGRIKKAENYSLEELEEMLYESMVYAELRHINVPLYDRMFKWKDVRHEFNTIVLQKSTLAQKNLIGNIMRHIEQLIDKDMIGKKKG